MTNPSKYDIVRQRKIEMTPKHFIELSTRRLYAFSGIIGIGPDLAIYEGSDGGLGEGAPLTSAEKREVAKIMLGRWHRFAIEIETLHDSKP